MEMKNDIQSKFTLAIMNLVAPETLPYRMLSNLNGAHQPISPCYNGRAMYNGPDEFFEIYNPYYHTNNPCYNGRASR